MGGLPEPSFPGSLRLPQRKLRKRPEPFRKRPQQGYHLGQLPSLLHLPPQKCSMSFRLLCHLDYKNSQKSHISIWVFSGGGGCSGLSKRISNPTVCYFCLHLQVPVASWFNDMSDTELLDLIPFFERLSKVDDIYDILEHQSTSQS